MGKFLITKVHPFFSQVMHIIKKQNKRTFRYKHMLTKKIILLNLK